MKRIVAFLLCVLLIGSVAGEVSWVQAAEEPIVDPRLEITSYEVQGVLGVPDVYAITINLKWYMLDGNESEVLGPPLESLTIEAASGNFKQAIQTNYVNNTFSISNTPIIFKSSELNQLNRYKTLSKLVYFIRTPGGDGGEKLTLGFDSSYKVKVGDKDVTQGKPFATNVLVIKSTPDPKEPEPPLPEPDPEPVDTTKFKPAIGVATDAALPLLDEATEELIIPIKNSAIYSASKITISMEPADKSKPLFTANRISVTSSISSLSRDQTKDAKFAVKLAPGATTGIHQVTLNYAFQNNYGDRFTDQEIAYIQVENRNMAPRLSVISEERLTPGKQTLVKFTLQNKGLTAARNIKATLEGLDPSGVSIISDVDVKYLDTIPGGGSDDIYYLLLPALSLEGSSTRLQVKLDYTDTNGQPYSDANSIFLPLDVVQEEEEGKGVPRLIISKYSFSPQEIRAGSHLLLDLDLQNTSRSKTITNLKVTIISEEGVFLPIDASNTLFIESIAPGETIPTSLALSTKGDAENKSYPLRITFDYEDSQGTSHNSQEMITIPVHQNSRLVVGEVVLYGEPMLHDMVPVNVEFYNLGKTILYNLMVQVEGPFRLEGGRYFVGNFNPGASDSFNFAVIPTEPGEQVGAVVFQFEDSIGTPIEVRRELKLNVMEPYYPDDPGPDIPMPPPSTSKWKYVGIGAGVLVVALAGFFFWRFRKKKKRLALQRAQDYTAATQAVVPEIEYVGFEDETQPNKSDPNR